MSAEHSFVDAPDVPFTPSGPQPIGLARPADGPLDAGGVNRVAETLTLRPLRDEIVEANGFPICSQYVDTFWLPVLGPSSISLLRHLSYQFAGSGDPYVVEAEVLGKCLGLGGVGRNAPLHRTLHRVVKFAGGVKEGPSSWRFRTHLAPLSRRALSRLPIELQAVHAEALAQSP